MSLIVGVGAQAFASVFFLLTSSAIIPLQTAAAAERSFQKKPNIVFILAEDMGFGDLACYGHPYSRTPNLDMLAESGTKFERFYVTGTTCNPSRTGIMTGRHPASFPNYMADFGLQNVTTITKLLRDKAGYRTGHVGKWHLGPDEDGESYGIDDVKVIGPTMTKAEGRDSAVFGGAIDFIVENQGRPFYLNIWTHIAHSPVRPPQNLVDLFDDIRVDSDDFDEHMKKKFRTVKEEGGNIVKGMQNYLADLWALDVQVGKLLGKLDDLGLRDDTLVVFTADHGAAPVDSKDQSDPHNMLGYAGGLRGGKHDFWDGGLREPFIIRWPGMVPAGKVNTDSIMWGMDWLPTISAIAGVHIDPNKFEGEDVSDIWFGESERSRTNPLLWKMSRLNSQMVILYDNWKLHIKNKQGRQEMQLYDLEADPGEDVNVFDTFTEIGTALAATLIEWSDALPAQYAKDGDEALPFDPDWIPYVARPPPLLTPPTMAPTPTLPAHVPEDSFGDTSEDANANVADNHKFSGSDSHRGQSLAVMTVAASATCLAGIAFLL